jgi:hypothetical protein
LVDLPAPVVAQEQVVVVEAVAVVDQPVVVPEEEEERGVVVLLAAEGGHTAVVVAVVVASVACPAVDGSMVVGEDDGLLVAATPHWRGVLLVASEGVEDPSLATAESRELETVVSLVAGDG